MTRAPLSRRTFLAASAAGVLLPHARSFAAEPTRLTLQRRAIEVNGEAASVYGIVRASGEPGITLEPGERFALALDNKTGIDTLIHWHGQTPPQPQDGVPGLSQPVLRAGQTYSYDFAPRPGTHWMHSHEGLHEQLLMAAPLIVRETRRADAQEVVVMLHDFTFKDAGELFARLGGGEGGHAAHMGHAAPAPDPHSGHSGPGAAAAVPVGAAHLHDVEYDAYLANDRTLRDPEIVRVERASRVRLRLINAATATAFIIDTGALNARAIAVDGNPIVPVEGTQFPLAMGQRLDLLLKLPGSGAWPVLARREGERERTGIILATQKASIAKLAAVSQRKVTIAGLDFESKLRADKPLARRKPDRRLRAVLGEQPPYLWLINDAGFEQRKPLHVRRGERVEIELVNPTSMMHPMHLHGHHFQVVALYGRALGGAMRDTVIVPARGGRVTIAFDADNPGDWPLHCHNLYHMAAGMMTTVRYET